MAKYGGLTIGPIVDTISMVAKPAGLWNASYLFSYFAEQLCLALLDEKNGLGITEQTIIEPVVQRAGNSLRILYRDGEEIKDASQIMKEEGVGLLHDRIIWKAESTLTEEEYLSLLKAAIEKAKERVAEAVVGAERTSKEQTQAAAYFMAYLSAKGVLAEVEEKENPLIVISDALDGVELKKKSRGKEEKNYVLTYLDNQEVKQLAYFPKTGKFRLAERRIKEGRTSWKFRELKEICQAERAGMKTEKYFAIVQADGDNMGKIVKQLKTEEEIRTFSMLCIKASVAAHEKIKEYGGYLIYAGGDDLLFLAPLLGAEGKKSLVTLLKELSRQFNSLMAEKFGYLNLEEQPALSFGVSVQYYKYPLYEAFEEGRYRLFGVAKCTDKKDAIAMRVRKGSGQSLALLLQGVSRSEYADQLDDFFGESIKDEVMTAVYQQFRFYEEHLKIAFAQEDTRMIKVLTKNIFDNAGQKGAAAYLARTLRLAESIHGDAAYQNAEEKVENFLSFLKLVQFYFEKGEQ